MGNLSNSTGGGETHIIFLLNVCTGNFSSWS